MYGEKYALIGSILAKADDSDRGSIDYAFKQACPPEALVDLSRVQGLPIHDRAADCTRRRTISILKTSILPSSAMASSIPEIFRSHTGGADGDHEY